MEAPQGTYQVLGRKHPQIKLYSTNANKYS